MFQRGTLGVRQERYGEAELGWVGPRRNRCEGDIQRSGSRAGREIPSPPRPRYQVRIQDPYWLRVSR